MELISSSKNPRVSMWRSLLTRKGRDEQNAFLVEGSRMVSEALSSDFEIRTLLLREDYRPAFHWLTMFFHPLQTPGRRRELQQY